MVVIAILVFSFIGVILYLSFAHEDSETKVVGLTFFLSFFLIGPLFSGIISIHAPIPMDNENTIEVVSIAVSLTITAMVWGLYKLIEHIRWAYREKRRRM